MNLTSLFKRVASFTVIGMLALMTAASAQMAPSAPTVQTQSVTPLGWLIDLVFSPFNPTSGIAQTIFTQIAPVTAELLGAVAIAEMMYYLANAVLTGSGSETMYRDIFAKVFRVSIVFVIVQHAGDIITGLYTYIGINLGQQFANLAAQGIGTGGISLASVNVSSPGTIVESGIGLAFSLLIPHGSTIQAIMGALAQAAFAGFITPMFFILAFSGVPPALMLALCWVRFTVSAYGVVLLGFLPSRVTQGIGLALMQLFTTLAVQTLAITGWCGLMVGVVSLIENRLTIAGTTANAALTQASPSGGADILGALQTLGQAGAISIETWIYATIGMVTLSVISLFVPKIAESWVTGTPSLSLGDAIRAMATVVTAALTPAAMLSNTATSLSMLGMSGGGAGGTSGGAGLPGFGSLGSGGTNSMSAGNAGGGGAGGAGGLGPFSPGMVRAAAIASSVGQPASGTLREMAQHFEPARGGVHLNAGV